MNNTINKKFIFAVLFMAFTAMLSALSVSADSYLYISGTSISGDISDSNLVNNTLIRESVYPGQTIKVSFNVRNGFSSSENLKLKDVNVDWVVEDIDGGDDLDDDFSLFDISKGDYKSLSFEFKVPTDAQEDTYKIKINARGKDSNGTTRSDYVVYGLEVKRFTHNLRFNRLSVVSDTPKCNDTLTYNFEIENTGRRDEKDTVVIVEAPLINFKKTFVTSLDRDNEYSSSGTIALTGSITGTVTFTATSYYETDKKSNSKTANIIIEACKAVTVTSAATNTSPSGIAKEGLIAQKTFKNSSAYTFLLAGGLLIVVCGVIALILVLYLRVNNPKVNKRQTKKKTKS